MVNYLDKINKEESGVRVTDSTAHKVSKVLMTNTKINAKKNLFFLNSILKRFKENSKII